MKEFDIEKAMRFLNPPPPPPPSLVRNVCKEVTLSPLQTFAFLNVHIHWVSYTCLQIATRASFPLRKYQVASSITDVPGPVFFIISMLSRKVFQKTNISSNVCVHIRGQEILVFWKVLTSVLNR